jgi:hypothetical protein
VLPIHSLIAAQRKGYEICLMSQSIFILDKNGRMIGKALGPREWESKDSIALFEYLSDSYVASSNL